MQTGGSPPVSHIADGGRGRVIDVSQIRAGDLLIAPAWPAGQGGSDPARGRADADAEPVVLAHQQQRYRQALVGAVTRGVERTDGSRVIDRRVTEAGDHDRVGR